jgi:hypothetical protein
VILSEIVLAAGSIAGVLTALALERAQTGRPVYTEPAVHRGDLERRIMQEARKRLHDYERAGKISTMEREKLQAKYRLQLDLVPAGFSADYGNEIMAHVDRRMEQINSRLDELVKMVGSVNNSGTAAKLIVEREESVKEKERLVKPEPTIIHTDTKSVRNIAQSIDTAEPDIAENDSSLDEIKKQIMQTLSRLEQAEVE